MNGRDIDRTGAEAHLFIVWPHARAFDSVVTEAVAAQFDVRSALEVHWTVDETAKNLSRFYRGRALPPYRTSLVDAKGTGPFLALVVVDSRPLYEDRDTPAGRLNVNSKVHDLKTQLRHDTGAGFGIHASDTARTARRELVLLFGHAAEELTTRPGWDGVTEPWREDPIATSGWRDLSDLHAALSATTRYIDLSLPGRGRIQLLTDEPKEVLSVLGATGASTYHHRSCGSYAVTVAGEPMGVDLRSVGDGFIDPTWASALLAGASVESGTPRPTPHDAAAFHLYDLLARPGRASESELNELRSMYRDLEAPWLSSISDSRSHLESLMRANGYLVTIPQDRCVRIDRAAIDSRHPRRATAIDSIASWYHRVVGPITLGPMRYVALSVREWLLVRVPALRRGEDLLRQRRPAERQ